MILRVFGEKPKGQVLAIVSIGFLAMIAVLCYLMVWEPFAAAKSMTNMNQEALELASSLALAFLSYIAGNIIGSNEGNQKKTEESEE